MDDHPVSDLAFVRSTGNLAAHPTTRCLFRKKKRDGPGLKEMRAEQVHCFALQETRMKRPPSKCQPDYFFVHPPHRSDGLGGVLVGLSKTLKLNGSDRDKKLKADDVTIIHSDSHLVILLVKNNVFESLRQNQGGDSRLAEIRDWRKKAMSTGASKRTSEASFEKDGSIQFS